MCSVLSVLYCMKDGGLIKNEKNKKECSYLYSLKDIIVVALENRKAELKNDAKDRNWFLIDAFVFSFQ